jgi:hypothetical protein
MRPRRHRIIQEPRIREEKQKGATTTFNSLKMDDQKFEPKPKPRPRRTKEYRRDALGFRDRERSRLPYVFDNAFIRMERIEEWEVIYGGFEYT